MEQDEAYKCSGREGVGVGVAGVEWTGIVEGTGSV